MLRHPFTIFLYGAELRLLVIFSPFFFNIPSELNTHDKVPNLSLLESIEPKRDGSHLEALIELLIRD